MLNIDQKNKQNFRRLMELPPVLSLFRIPLLNFIQGLPITKYNILFCHKYKVNSNIVIIKENSFSSLHINGAKCEIFIKRRERFHKSMFNYSKNDKARKESLTTNNLLIQREFYSLTILMF